MKDERSPRWAKKIDPHRDRQTVRQHHRSRNYRPSGRFIGRSQSLRPGEFLRACGRQYLSRLACQSRFSTPGDRHVIAHGGAHARIRTTARCCLQWTVLKRTALRNADFSCMRCATSFSSAEPTTKRTQSSSYRQRTIGSCWFQTSRSAGRLRSVPDDLTSS